MQGEPLIEKPVFVVGMPRSGTTLVLEVLSARSDLAWFSRPLNRVPWLPAVCTAERFAAVHPSLRSIMYRSDQIGTGLRRVRRLERLRLGPTEGTNVWRHWAGERFMSDFMLGVQATDRDRRRLRMLVSKLLRYEAKPRFVAKLTGPTRVGYLSSVFPDAHFVHVLRDLRAVAHSLLHNHPGWRDTFRTREPAWEGLDEELLKLWTELGQSSLALAAIEWRAVIESARSEASEVARDRYLEVRYEDFVADPHGKLDELTAFCDLPRSPEPHEFLDRRISIRDMNYQWRKSFGPEEVKLLDDLGGDLLGQPIDRTAARTPG